jgi:hypothetical protein
MTKAFRSVGWEGFATAEMKVGFGDDCLPPSRPKPALTQSSLQLSREAQGAVVEPALAGKT